MKRWTLRIVLLLVLGCVTTVAVAWGLALWIHLGPAWRIDQQGWDTRDFAEGPGQRAGINRYSELGCEVLATWWTAYTGVDETWHPTLPSLPDWGSIRRPVPFEREPGSVVSRDGLWFAYGWPLVAAVVEWKLGHNASSGARTGLAGHGGTDRVLPLRPIWPGFVINTLFYGVIWFGIFFGFGSARRTIRKRRGRCPKCAYQLRGQFDAGCSECGWNRPEGSA